MDSLSSDFVFPGLGIKAAVLCTWARDSMPQLRKDNAWKPGDELRCEGWGSHREQQHPRSPGMFTCAEQKALLISVSPWLLCASRWPLCAFSPRDDVLLGGRAQFPAQPGCDGSSCTEVWGLVGSALPPAPASHMQSCPTALPATALCWVAGTAALDPPGTELHAYKLTVSHQGSAPFCCNVFERTEKIEQEVKDFFLP